MHTPRKRTLVTNAGLLTAVTLSLCLLAGCNGARFMMGGDPSQPVSPTGTSATTPATAGTLKFNLTPTLNGARVEIASVRAYDALTGAPLAVNKSANVIAAGGANYSVQQSLASGTGLTVSGFTGVAVNILVTTTTGKKIATMVLADYNYAFKETEGGGMNLSTGAEVNINENTTVAAQFARGPLKMMGSLKREIAEDLVKTFLTAMDNMVDRIDQELDAATTDQLLASMDDQGRITDGQKLTQFVEKSGLTSLVDSTVQNATQSVAEKAKNRANVIKNIEITAADFAGTSYDIKLDGSKILIVNKTTGETTTVDLNPEPAKDDDNQNPDDQTNQDPDGITEDPDAGTGDPKLAPVYSSANFQPTVSFSGNLTISVTQPLGSDDVSTVYARIPKANLTSATISALTATGSVTGGTPLTGPLALAVEGTPNTVSLPPDFGGGSPGTQEYAGKLKLNSTVVADFQVWSSSSYYYLITTYALTDAVKTNGGYTTTLAASGFGSITSGTVAEVVLTSRTGETYKDFNLTIVP